jgi:hypothetical protein
VTLTSADHARVKRASMDARNAGQRHGRWSRKRAEEWVARTGATVRRDPVVGGLLYTVHVPGFHPQYGARLEWAVAQLAANVDHFCSSPTASRGPTGASLRRLREALGGD